MEDKIWLARPYLSQIEENHLIKSIRLNWVSTVGGIKEEFKNSLADYFNVSNDKISLLNSGTSALHLALLLAGVKASDFVLCSTATFVASANPIKYIGASPIFIDSESDSWNICPDLLEKSLAELNNKNIFPKALVLVHLYGVPSKILEILDICSRYNILLIEDVAEAFGSSVSGKMLGTFGDYGVLSFNGNKLITSGSGGALISKFSHDTLKADFLSSQAKEMLPYYEHREIGYNYSMDNLSASVGLGQLQSVSKILKLKQRLFEKYKIIFDRYRWKYCVNQLNEVSNNWLSVAVLDSFEQKENIRLALERNNIESRNFWKPMHMQPVFENEKAYLNGVSEGLFEKGLCFPSDINMTEQDFERIESVIENAMKN